MPQVKPLKTSKQYKAKNKLWLGTPFQNAEEIKKTQENSTIDQTKTSRTDKTELVSLNRFVTNSEINLNKRKKKSNRVR